MDVAFLITTRNRPQSCQRLVDAISPYGDVFVLNDGCNYIIRGAKQVIRHEFYGKWFYWKTVNQLFSMRTPHKYYIMLPDDFMPADNMVEKAIETWESIADKDKICLNLYADRIGRSCWTGFFPTNRENVYRTGWVDMCFICEDRFFDALGLIPQTTVRQSSGVGAYISKFLHRNDIKYNFYQVKESLVIPQPEHYLKSQMQHDIYRNSNSKRKGKPLPRSNFKRLLPGR